MNPIARNGLNGGLAILLSLGLVACGGGGGASGPGLPATGLPADGAIQVEAPSGENAVGGYAILTWKEPSQRADGSSLGELEEYRISYGLSPGVYSEQTAVRAAEMSCVGNGELNADGTPIKTCSFMIDELPTASWYFAVQAVDSSGMASDFSNEVIKTVQ
jgi:hypothetical protein